MQVAVTGAWKQPPFIILLLLMAAFGYFLYRKLIWDLADEVRDGGSFLLVYKGSVEVRVPLANVMNVSMNQFSNPKRLTLRLRTPCALGDEIVFMPKLLSAFNPFARNPIAEDLMRRVDNARRGETA
jgi:hypothetical protein